GAPCGGRRSRPEARASSACRYPSPCPDHQRALIEEAVLERVGDLASAPGLEPVVGGPPRDLGEALALALDVELLGFRIELPTLEPARQAERLAKLVFAAASLEQKQDGRRRPVEERLAPTVERQDRC